MAEAAKMEVFPFGSKGLVLKEDPAQVQPGQYQELTNVVSTLEGTVNIRDGDQRLTSNGSYGGDAVAIIDQISSLPTSSTRYIGGAHTSFTPNKIYRSTGGLPSSGASMAFTPVATGIDLGLGIYPFTEINFNGGDTGQNYAYFACQSKMLKDDGTFNPLQQWGIVQPSIPAQAKLSQTTILPATELITGSGRVNTSVSSASGGAPGVFSITPASMVNIINGMEVTIGGAFVTIVQDALSTSFEAYCPTTPSGAITSGEETVTAPTQFAAITGLTIDASFQGLASDGFTSADPVHISIATSNANAITDFRLRVLVGGSASDYYEKSISVASVQATIGQTSTATQQITGLAQGVDLNVYGPYDLTNEQINQLRAAEINPISSVSPTNLAWSEVDIPKNQFVSVGLAGQTNFTWAKVTGFQVVYTAGAGTIMYIGSICIHGGFGPNGLTTSATTPLLSYDYVYTYRNPVTGVESNPSPLMIANNAVAPQQQQVAVTIHGTGDPQVAGTGSIGIYRRGGTYSDSFFRQLGFAVNPGAGTAGVFFDTISDESITGANTALFDNDPPVTSSLPIPYIANITAITGGGLANQLVTLTLDATFGVGMAPTNGSVVTISGGLNMESTIVNATPGGAQITCYIQYNHAVGEQVEVDAITGQPCRFGCAAFGSIFLGGDPNNPQTLYQSKIGRPEYFPVVNLETQVSQQITVGDPSDPIMALTEFGGQLVSLNFGHIYIVPVFAGVMEAPVKTPAERGLVQSVAWCKVDNELWYLSYDGIYSWNGGGSTKRTEAIDPLFRGAQIGQYFPIDFGGFHPNAITMAYYRNEVRMSYYDTQGNSNLLRYNLIHDRWSIDYSFDVQNMGSPAAVTAQYLEPGTGNMFRAKTVGGLAYLYLEDDTATTDGWVTTPTDGASIEFSFTPGSYMLGSASLQKQFSDIIVDLENDTLTDVGLFVSYDYAAMAGDNFVITGDTTLGRHRAVVTLQNGFGKEAYAMTLRFVGEANAPATFYSLTFNYIQLTQVQVGRAFDWDDLGYPHDKRLYQMQITYDIPAGQSETVIMDTITGVIGAQVINTAVQSFTLTPPTGTFTGPTHLTASFPIQDEVIIKKVRIRPSVSSSFLFKIWGYTFQPFEQYPPDVMPFTEWTDFGYPYYKYAQQVVLDINTNNVQATFNLFADGAGSPSATFNVTSTPDDRKRIFTLPPNIAGKKFRLTATAGSGGKFQLFNLADWLIWLPADKGPVSHTYDWDALEWPYDKKLIRVTIEYNTVNSPTTMFLDTMTGIKGETINSEAFAFVLDGPGRSLQTFNFPDDTYAKQIRFYPQADNFQLQEWKYKFDKIDYPADIALFTDYSDFGWPCEKIARNLILVINTGGVACSVSLIADGTVMQVFSVTSTIDNRIPMIIACNSELIGRLWKLELTPGTNGQSQLFSWSLDYVKEPCAVTYYDSYETDMGYQGWKWLYQGWIHYAAPSELTVTFFVEDDVQFYQITLPAQAHRDMQRFYFPALWFTNSVPALNKSRIYRMTITSATSFKLYADSRIEFGKVGADRRASFGQFALSAEQQNVVQSPLISMGAPK